MMKMAMRIDKSQIKTIEKLVNGQSGQFRRTPAIQAGFKTIDAMCIGGSGGYLAAAANAYYGAGSGGGGSAMWRGNIKDLAEITNYGAGQKGADSGSPYIAAADGTYSYFGGVWGGGGKGASGIQPGWGNSDVYASIGGEGGGNSWGVGAGGNGGNAPFTWGGLGYGGQAPTNGSWVDLGGGNGGGKGGGGGAGQSNRAGYTGAATSGAYGSVPTAQGPPTTWLGGSYGGQGGGADLFPHTGAHEIYGTYSYGVVAWKLT